MKFYIIRFFPFFQEKRYLLRGPVRRPCKGCLQASGKKLTLAREVAPHLQIYPAVEVFGADLRLVDKTGVLDVYAAYLKESDRRGSVGRDAEGPLAVACRLVVYVHTRQRD